VRFVFCRLRNVYAASEHPNGRPSGVQCALMSCCVHTQHEPYLRKCQLHLGCSFSQQGAERDLKYLCRFGWMQAQMSLLAMRCSRAPALEESPVPSIALSRQSYETVLGCLIESEDLYQRLFTPNVLFGAIRPPARRTSTR
jgi:hypothetical protein